MFERLLTSDLHTLKLMWPYIGIGLLIIAAYVLIMKAVVFITDWRIKNEDKKIK